MKVSGCGVMLNDADKGKESIYIFIYIYIYIYIYINLSKGHFIHKKIQFGLFRYSHTFKSYMIIDTLKLCFDLESILLR